MDNKEKSGFRDVISVDLNDPSAVDHWMKHWDVSEQELREAVAQSNNNLVSTIAAYFKSEAGK